MFLPVGLCAVGLVLLLLMGRKPDMRWEMQRWPNKATSLITITKQQPVAGKRPLSQLIAERVRVFCVIHTISAHHSTLASAVNSTWAPRCNGFSFVSTEPDTTLTNMVKLAGVQDGREHRWSRSKAALRHVYEYHLDDYDWFISVEDDAYLVLENLRYFLLAYDPNEKIYQSCRLRKFYDWAHLSAGYAHGGGVGHVLSRAALRTLIERGLNAGTCSATLTVAPFADTDDAQMGRCFEKLGVTPGDCGAAKRRLVNQTTSLRPGHPALGNRLDDYSIGFGHVSPNESLIVESVLNRLRRYGTDLAIDRAENEVDEDPLLLSAYLNSINSEMMGYDKMSRTAGVNTPITLPGYLCANNTSEPVNLPSNAKCSKFLRVIKKRHARLVAWHASRGLKDERSGATAWKQLWQEYTSMWSDITAKLNISEFRNKDESKYFLDFVDTNSPCFVVTLGVGLDVEAELKLLSRYPQCRFVLADGDPRNEPVVKTMPNSSLVAFVPRAVGAEAGLHQALIYGRREPTIEHMAITELFDKYVPRKNNGSTALIDMLLIDIEGGELALLDAFTDGRLDAYTVCQMNVEFHSPAETGRSHIQALDRIAAFVASNQSFVPLVASIVHRGLTGSVSYNRIFFVNVGSPECIAKFIC